MTPPRTTRSARGRYAKLIREERLPWGGTLLVTKFPAHGSVSFVGSLTGGTRAAPSAELARVHAAMLLDGTRTLSKKEIQEKLDAIGATLAFGVSRNRLTFSGRVRVQHLRTIFTLLGTILRDPIFPEEELEMLKKRDFASLALAAQDTHTQADLALARLIHSPSHPNWVESTEESRAALEALTRADLEAHHARVLGRRGLILSLAGDITVAEAKRLARAHFEELPDREAALPRFEQAAQLQPRTTTVTIEHKASIDFMTGLSTGITSAHKDYPALMLGMQILGNPGGFTGRLMSTVREIEGLTYGVYAYVSGFTKDIDGYLDVWGTFAPQLYAQGKKSVLREIRRIVEEGVTQVEVKKHRALYEARARTGIANSGAFARAAHDVVAQGYAVDRLDTFPQKVLRLSAKDVNAALKKYLLPSKLSEAAAGPIGIE